MTAADGVPLDALEEAALAQLATIVKDGVTGAELARARRQLSTRLVFENDSVTNMAHQLGYFEAVAGPGYFGELQPRIASVTAYQVGDVARRRLAAAQRTVGWFRPAGRRACGAA
jgi:zinc protease